MQTSNLYLHLSFKGAGFWRYYSLLLEKLADLRQGIMSNRALTPLSVKDWLDRKTPQIKRVVNGCAHYNRLADALQQIVGEKYQSNVFLGPLKGSRLVVYTDRAAYATQLHYILNGNLADISKITGLPIRNVDIKVDPRRVKKAKKPARKPSKSASGATFLTNTAKSLGDAPVATAMSNLAKIVNKKS